MSPRYQKGKVCSDGRNNVLKEFKAEVGSKKFWGGDKPGYLHDMFLTECEYIVHKSIFTIVEFKALNNWCKIYHQAYNCSVHLVLDLESLYLILLYFFFKKKLQIMV